MRQGNSRQLFVHMLKTMLKDRGIYVNKLQLEKFLLFVEKVCPWFPEKRTGSLKTCKKVGKQLQTYYSLRGPNRVPVDAFSLWTLIRDCLDPEHERHKIQTALRDCTEPEVAEPSAPPPEPLYAVPEGTACKAGGSDDVLSSGEQEELNEQAAHYHREDMPWEMMVNMQSPSGKGELKHSGLSEEQLENLIQKIVIAVKMDAQGDSHSRQPVPLAYPPRVFAGLDPPPPFVEPRELLSIPASLPGENIKTEILSPLQQTIKRANDERKHIPGFSGIYPVFENAQQQRYYEPLPFKQLKELKMACTQYGPTGPFTQAIIKALKNQNLPPNDWKQVARACLSGRDFLLWKSEFAEQYRITADINQRQRLNTTYKMMVGEGDYRDTNNQLNYLPGVYPQINAAALRT